VTNEDKIAEAITSQAAEHWLLQRERTVSERDRDALLAWLRESPTHVLAYLSMAACDRSLRDGAHDWPETAAELVTSASAQPESNAVPIQSVGTIDIAPRLGRAPVPRRGFAFAVALSVGVAVLISGTWLLRSGELPGLLRVYETAHAEQGSWPLPDGSVLHLDSNSRAVLHFSSAERVVSLERGQAMFHVAKDLRRRFRVDAGNAQIVAVGTEFNVSRDATDTRVVVLEGRVSVARGLLQRTNFPTLDLSGATALKAGEQLEIDSSHVGAPRPADVRHARAWLQREIVFDNLPLAQVVADFNRYAPQPIEIEDKYLERIPISGVFGAYDVESFVAFLRKLDGVRVLQGPTYIRVYGRSHEPIAADEGANAAESSGRTM
jgi:transmembrane sensor